MITEEEKKPKVLSTEELLKRFNAQKAGTPGVLNEDLDPWGSKLVDIDTMLSGKPQTPKVPEAKPVPQDTTKPTAEFDGTLDWKNLQKSKKDYEKEPRLSAKEYFQGLGNKVKSSVMGLGEMVMETPQGIEALSNAPAVMLTEAMIRRKVRRGEMDPEAGDILMKEAKAITPRRTLTGNMVVTDQMPGEMLAEGDLNKWFEENKVKFSEMGDKYDKTATQYLTSGQFGKALGAISYGIAESIAPTIAAAFIPGGAAALGLGVGTTSYDEVKGREDMSEAMKMADAVTVGVFEWLFERFGTREMTKQLFDIYKKTGKDGIVNAVNSKATQNLFAKAYKKFGVWLAPVHEGISEGLTTLGQNFAAIFSGEDPERKIADGFWDSVLIGAGMGGMFSLTEKTAEQYRIAREGKAGPITGPLTIEDQDPEQMIRDLGKKYAYNGFNGELPDQNFIKYGEMKDGRKVIIKSTNFATDPANMLVAVVDAENPESKPQMVKGNMINNSMDVPYEQWVQNEMRNYQATMSQISNETAKATAPVQEGATIPIGEQLFNVTQVTDQGIVLNEIDNEGNLTANTQTITPDKYGEVFGVGPTENEAPMPQEGAQQPNMTAEQPAAAPAQPKEVSQQSRKVSDGKNEFTIIPQEDGNFRMSESFETQKEAEAALKKLQERYPKLTWSAEMTDSGDLFTPDTYTIVAAPKKKPAAPVAEAPKVKPEQKPVEAPAAAPEVKAEVQQPVSQAPSTPDETAAEEEVQNAGEVEPQPTIAETAQVEPQKKEPADIERRRQEELRIPEERVWMEDAINVLAQYVNKDYRKWGTESAYPDPGMIMDIIESSKAIPEDLRIKLTRDGIAVSRGERLSLDSKEINAKYDAELAALKGGTPQPEVAVAKAEGQVDLRPTEAQKEAGNYKKGHLNIKGFDISIENPAGSVRSGVSKDGTKWSNLMNNTYGYFRRTEGKDGDQVDVFLGDNLDSDAVYVVDQVDPETGVFDEHKVMMGFNSAESARENYLANYEPGWKGLGSITKMSMEGFKEWLGDAKRTRKPIDANVEGKKETESTDMNIFPDPGKTVIAEQQAKKSGKVLSLEEGQKVIQSWKDHVDRISAEEDHSKEIILSIYDRTGNWGEPYAMAGYKVVLFDISHGADMFATSPISIIEDIEEMHPGAKIVGILSAPPCTSFSVSGAWAWQTHDVDNNAKVDKLYGPKAAQMVDKPIEAAEMLVNIVDEIIAQARLKGHGVDFYALENPVGRIAERTGLPKPTMTFQPNLYGDPYTKKTMLWGEFNPNLPQAYVEATEGSKITTKLSGSDKAGRSATPEGFAYSFFMANNTSKLKFEEETAPVEQKQPEDTRPVKKLKEKKGWPMSKADEARLSREPQSFEEAVYQFFIGRGRISTASLKHHLGTRSREDYSSYIWAHKKDGQKTDKLNEAHIFQAHPELLKQTGDQQDQERAFMDILLSVHGLNDMRTRIDEMQRKADEINAEPVVPEAEEEIDYIDAGQVVDEEILPLEEEDPEILRIFELEINELGKTLDDLKNLAANDPDYFQVFPYGLNEKQFNELKSILNDTERQKQIIGLDHEVNQSESRSEGDNEVPGSPEPESRTDGESRGERGTEEPAISAEQLERERAAIEEWLPTSDHEDYISFEWDGESLEIFKGRDERIVGLSRDQLIEEGVRFPEAVAPAVGLKTSNHTVRSYANGLIDLDKAKEKINLALASLTSGRGFNQSFEDYMEQNPDVRKRNDELEAIKAYLATNPTPEQTREVLTEPLSNAKPEFAGEFFEQPTEPKKPGIDQARSIVQKIGNLESPSEYLKDITLPKEVLTFFNSLRKSPSDRYIWSVYGKGFKPFSAGKINSFFDYVNNRNNSMNAGILKDMGFDTALVEKADANRIWFTNGVFLSKSTGKYKSDANHFYAGTQVSLQGVMEKQLLDLVSKRLITREQAYEIEQEESRKEEKPQADNSVSQWVDAFNKAKEGNDLEAIQDLYNKVTIYLNGPAQKYGVQAVNDLTQLKNQIEAYAEEVKKSKEAKPEFVGEIFEKPKEEKKSELTLVGVVRVDEDVRYNDDQRFRTDRHIAEYRDENGTEFRKSFFVRRGDEPNIPKSGTHDEINALKDQISSKEKPEGKSETKEYKYKMLARPFDVGTYPKEGFIRSENDPNGGFQILAYDRKLPVKEWSKWDFLPITDIEQTEEKEFTDKDEEYSRISLEWTGNKRFATVSMYDTNGDLVEEPFSMSVKDIIQNIEMGYWIEKATNESTPSAAESIAEVSTVKAIWQMTKQDFVYSPLRYDTMPTTDGSGIFRAEENADGTWNAWVEFPDGKRDYWTRGGSAGEAWDGGKRKTAYMNQEADAKSMDRHREAVIQALNEGKEVPEDVLRNYIGLKDYLEKHKKKEAVKPKEKESPIPANLKEQIDNLKALVIKESEGLDTNRRIADINALEAPTKGQIKERNQLRLILDNTRAEIARRNDKVDYNIIPENKVREIRKLIEEARAQDEAIGQRILRLQDERDAKEKSLQKRAGLFGDRKEEEERKSGMQSMFAGEIFEATSDNLQAALKPFNDAIKKAEEEWKRNAQLLDQKIALVLSGAQMEIEMDPPAEPASIAPIDKESLPKHEDFGEKIGGARKDMGITRTIRDTDALPAWRRKYFYADPSGVMNLGDPTIDTSKPFLVKWSKEVKSWSGTRTMGYPVTTIDTREPKIFNSEAEAEAYIPIYEVWKQNFRIRKKDGNYVITKTSSTGKVVEYATFPTEEEATTYLYSTEGATSLLNHKREDFSIPALDKVERTGKDWRKGKDISTDEFMETFGFRGGEFGNWVKPEERRVMLNAAYDSFMDLADMLKVPPRAMSLSGELSIAFGARGTKGAAAHFEPDRAVINLTRMNGAGSLAHEWAHALDNYFGLQAAKKDYARNEEGELKAGRVMRTTADLLSKRGMRKELSEIFDAILKATQEKSVTRVMGIDEKQKAYDGQIKRLKDEAEALVRKFENGVRRYKYDRKAKKHGEVIVKATPEQIKRAKAIIDKIIDGKGTRPKWAHIPGSKGHMEYSYISPETMAMEELFKEVFGRSGLKRDGNGFYNLGYFADKAYAAKEILDKALAGESETLTIPTEFLKTSKIFDRSRANPYWSTKVEMFARAFEYFIETKLEEQNIRADYLQYDKAPVYDAVYEMNPYPAGEERTALNELFQKFFDEVKTKEEFGRTAMFRTGRRLISDPKLQQFEIILATNPMTDDVHTGIRSVKDIKTAEEAFKEIIDADDEAAPDFTASDMKQALVSGRITIYSSYPIQNGVFITPSKMQAEAYAGNGNVYSKTVNIGDVAWIDYIEGQYANVSNEEMFRTSNQVYYSPIEKALEAIKQNKATAKQWKAMLLNNGAKQAELDWMGWDDMIEAGDPSRSLTKDDIQKWIASTKVEIKDVTLDDTKENAKGRRLELKAEAGRRTIDEVQEEIGFRPYLLHMTGEWVYKDSDGEVQSVPDEYLDDLNKAQEAIQALEEFDEAHINIAGEYTLGGTKYGKYVLPGGKDYKELLLTMPTNARFQIKPYNNGYSIWDNTTNDWYRKELAYSEPMWFENEALASYSMKTFYAENNEKGFISSHWDEPNILAHIRFNTRTSEDGKNILFIEEIQSDWAQKGKKEGYASILTDKQKQMLADGIPMQNIKGAGVPNMPFKKTEQWAGLAIRRMIKYAIDEGFDAIAWTTGEQQAERYDLSKQLDVLRWMKESNGTYTIIGKKNGRQELERDVPANELESTVGKEIAEKILTDKSGIGELKGENLRVGGYGMKAFYDEILPSIANKIGKKYNAKVGEELLPEEYHYYVLEDKEKGTFSIYSGNSDLVEDGWVSQKDAFARVEQLRIKNGAQVHSMPITDSMFNAFREGVPMFRRGEVPKPQYETGYDALARFLEQDEIDDQRHEVKLRIESLGRELNTPVKAINNRNELPPKVQAQAKRIGVWENETMYGAWDEQTGTMFILLDDLMKLGPQRATTEGIKTVLHEAVAHKGLPILLGDRGYDNLVNEIYDSIPDDDLTLIRYQYGWTEDKKLIAEEYLGMMAEDNVNPSLFQRIIAKIRQLLRKYFKVAYSKNDVYTLLRASRKNLENAPEEERGFYRSRPQPENFEYAGEFVQAQGTYFRTRKAASVKRNSPLGKAAEAYMEKAAKRTGEETVQGIREYIQDLSLPIRRFEEELLRRGGKQDNTSKPYRDMSLSFGRQEKLYNDYFEGNMKPILQAVADIKRAGIPGEDILPYIIAKHAMERNPAFRSRELKEWVESHKENVPQDEVNAKMEELKDKDYSGVMGFDTDKTYTNPDELARDIVSEFEGKVDAKLINNLWNKIGAATSEILDTWQRGHQITPEQKQEYLSQFRYFVPLRGWREGAAKELVYTKGDGFSRSLQYAKGRKSLADNPLAYLLNVQFQAIAEQVDNEVKTSMVNLIIKNLSNNEMHEMATIKKLYYVKITLPDGTEEWEPTTTRPPQEMFDAGDAKTKIYSEHERLRKPRQAREHEVYVRKPGGDMVMVFNGKHLSTAQAMNKQNYMYRTIFGNIYDARDLNKVMALMGHMNNMLKALYTSWNVVFPFTNFMRDFQEASITQQIKSKSGGKVIKNYRAAFPAIIRRIQGKQNLSNPIDQQLEDFYNLGGATGYTHMKSPEEIEEDINKEVARMVRKGSIAGGIGDAGHALFAAVEHWNKIFEDATRFSVYLSSLAIGNSKQDAAMDAKEASVNFNRKGKGSKAWDAWFAFFNVAVQSMQKNFKLAKDTPKRFTQIAFSFVMLGFLEAMMNALTDDEDDPDSSYYNLNSYMRQNYLVIPLPQIGNLRKKGNKYLSIPLPQFWRGFKSIGSIGFDVATGRMKAGEAVTTALGNFAGGLLPIDVGGFYKSGEFSVAPLVPTITKPVVELIENRNYMGYTIKKEPFTREQAKYLADAGLGKDNVNPAAKFFTDMLFRWSGGDSRYKYYTDKQGRTRKVLLDVNPSTVEHLFKGYTGGTGSVVSDLMTTVSQVLDKEQEIDFRNTPFVNKFLRNTPEHKWQIISEFYDLKEANDRDITLMKEYERQGRETGNTSQYERMAEDEYRIERKMIFDSYEDQISDLTKGVTKDDMESSSLVIEQMDMCIGEIKRLEARYKRKY